MDLFLDYWFSKLRPILSGDLVALAGHSPFCGEIMVKYTIHLDDREEN